MLPAFSYWFSGAAVAAFVVFAGAGYGWYRAALSELQSAEQKASDSAKARNAATIWSPDGSLVFVRTLNCSVDDA
jgi:hypothetical protein